MPESSDKKGSDSAEPAFEDALAQLESLVREMESEQMPLEDLIKNYEEGTRLFQVCEKRLDEAEGRIELIRKNRNGETVVEPFDEESPTSLSGESDSSSTAEASQEHGELF